MMSNPAVFELAKADIAGQRICIEDNIGESIHLHIGLVRIDMTVKEFQNFALTLQKVFNVVTPDFFDVEKYDAYFVERIASEITNLSTIEQTFLSLAEIKFCYETDSGFITCKIVDSPAFKYYSGEKYDLDKFENNGDIFQSNAERADKVFTAVKNNVAKNFRICVDEKNRILDGYLTVAALAKIHGIDTKVAVNRFKFEKINDSIAVRRLKKKLW